MRAEPHNGEEQHADIGISVVQRESIMNRTDTAALIVPDGIVLTRDHLKRRELVERVMEVARAGNQYVVLGSPPGTGKTSLLQLVSEAYCSEFKPKQTLQMSLNKSVTPELLFKELKRYGMEFGADMDMLIDLPDTLLMIDDSQIAYGADFDGFWQFLVKNVGPKKKKGKLFVVIASTYHLEVPGSPVSFRNLPHIPGSGETLAVSSEEADQLFLMHAGQLDYGGWTKYCDALKEISNLHIGVLVQGLLLLQNMHRSNERMSFTEEAAINSLRHPRFLQLLFRCFPVRYVDEQGGGALSQEMTKHYHDLVMDELLGITQVHPDPFVNRLKHAGIFGVDGGFSCIATNWYYNQVLFPLRAIEVPGSLEDLIVQSVECMSASRLRACREQPGNKFPKEAAFQHLFNEAMSVNLPIKYLILPEMNTRTTKPDGSKQTGELDFYVNSTLMWAIELLRNGSAINEHRKRFHKDVGKYRDVPQNSYLVVDCRPPKKGTGVRPTPDRCTLYFAEDFKTCICKMRQRKEEIVIELKP